MRARLFAASLRLPADCPSGPSLWRVRLTARRAAVLSQFSLQGEARRAGAPAIGHLGVFANGDGGGPRTP
eukprot:791348-Lingulodinium_polyedra.AAC.1